jgi:pimeloyl-ACP methyl ester carboxylesterase
MGGEGSIGDSFAQALPQLGRNVRSVVVPDSGHWMPEENPQFVSRQLLDFFDAALRDG